MDIIELGNSPQECKLESEHIPDYNSKQIHVLDADKKGFLLWQCDKQMTNGSNGWCALDIEWNNGAVWTNPEGFRFQLAEAEHADQGYTTLFWVLLGTELPAGSQPVQWNNVNGFIVGETNTVVLFTEDFVYQYEDRIALAFQHMFLTGPDKLYLNFTALKVPLSKYFSCDGKPFLERNMQSKPAESRVGRLKVIYGLFGAHFFVAAIMIVIIVIFTIMVKKDNQEMATSQQSEGPKRVRKGNRSPSSRGGSNTLDSKSNSSKSNSNKSAKSETK